MPALGRRIKIGITVVVFMLLAISAFFMARVEMPAWSYMISSLSVVAFALPSIWAASMWLGRRDAVIMFASLGLLSLLIELFAITTGIPYGRFAYSDRLGYLIFDVVPWTVALAWPPLLLGAYSVAAQISCTALVRILLTTSVLTLFDLVLDPGAVYLGFWHYADAAGFYGVPFSNFAGWLVSGLIGAIVLEGIRSWMRPLLPVPIQLSSSALLTVFFWALLDAFARMWTPAGIGAFLLAGMVLIWQRSHYAFEEMVVLVDDDNNPIGTETRLAVHNSETRLHRAFSAFIFNSRGELLLQQRSFSKRTWPGVWSNSCCGHVQLYETTEKAAARRLSLELGLNGIELTTVLPDFRYRAEKDSVVENEICPVLVGTTEELPKPNPIEVVDVRWIDWHELLKGLDEGKYDLSPWAVLEIRLLAESESFRNWLADRSLGQMKPYVNLAATNL